MVPRIFPKFLAGVKIFDGGIGQVLKIFSGGIGRHRGAALHSPPAGDSTRGGSDGAAPLTLRPREARLRSAVASDAGQHRERTRWSAVSVVTPATTSRQPRRHP